MSEDDVGPSALPSTASETSPASPANGVHASSTPVTPEERPATPDPCTPDVSVRSPGRESARQGGYASASGTPSSAGASNASLNGSVTSRKDSYSYMNVLGYGSYSRVVMAVHKATKQEYAVKVVSKVQIQARNELQCVKAERDILKQCNHPNIVKLIETFQSPDELFYVMEHAAGGELLSFIKRVGRFDLHIVRHVTAEIINALEYLHSKGIVHRDLKPENLLLDAKNHVKLVDFGTAFMQTESSPQPPKMEIPQEGDGRAGSVNMPPGPGQGVRGQTFCGTFQYISPELLDHGMTTTASDLWAMGCIVYQMTAGHRPFDDGSVMLIFDKIRNPTKYLTFTADFYLPVKDLVNRLLVIDPKARLGTPSMGGYPVLKAHQLFQDIDFENLPTQELHYKWKPSAPVWVSDDSVTTCRGCSALFTLTNRRHHCRKCGDIFCKSCSKHQSSIPGLYVSKVRVCNTCFRSLRKSSIP
eukprot:TRINITY_DN3368_c0_g1_i2.p1 TRINITY_DN3368_c0_g1~~TRINITY_DN3368_c0_g1_i2.p1  ORF type:complete len:473 (+),score=55.76 TRINITY_DN3368_c0_g1_i2:340-1758(+)